MERPVFFCSASIALPRLPVVKSSQVKFKFQWRLRPPPLGERSGGRGAAQLAWLESPEQGLTGFVHIVLNS